MTGQPHSLELRVSQKLLDGNRSRKGSHGYNAPFIHIQDSNSLQAGQSYLTTHTASRYLTCRVLLFGLWSLFEAPVPSFPRRALQPLISTDRQRLQRHCIATDALPSRLWLCLLQPGKSHDGRPMPRYVISAVATVRNLYSRRYLLRTLALGVQFLQRTPGQLDIG